MTVVKSCFYVFIFIGIVYCLKVVPERAKVLFADTNYLEGAKIYVSRHGRKSSYYLNVEANIPYPMNNNVTIHLIFHEYLHNEYRRSFVEFHSKLCDFLKEPYIGSMFASIGVFCPVVGDYHLQNLTFPTENFPYVFPFEKFRVDVYINTTEKNIMMYLSQVFVHVQMK